MNKITNNHTLPTFLTDSKYRTWRHLIFGIIGTIIVFNQVFIAYQDCSSILGNRIYLICFSSCFLYFVAIYFNYYFLVPRFLLKNRYGIYSIILSAIVFLLPTIAIIQEYWVRNFFDLPHRITSYTNPLILVDNLASCTMTVICFLCVTIVQLFNSWVKKNEHVNRLEYEHTKSEVNKLKGQITPGFLSKILNHTSELVKTNPQKTTDMLMKLGQLLRYQLYDCNREKVLIKSEINFLSNFLALEQINENRFQYQIETKGNFNNIFVSPLLFISLIQNTVENSSSLNLTFNIENEMLFFQCKSDNESGPTDEELFSIKKSLDLQYPGKHTLLLEPGIIDLQIDIAGS